MNQSRALSAAISRRTAKLQARESTTIFDWQHTIPNIQHDCLRDILSAISSGIGVPPAYLRPNDRFDRELALEARIFFRIKDPTRARIADALESRYGVRPSAVWNNLIEVVSEAMEFAALPRLPIRRILDQGIAFEIDLTFFDEPNPLFAYVDDLGREPKMLQGLEICGAMTIGGQPDFMWLSGPRSSIMFSLSTKQAPKHFVYFASGGGGEFCLEIYHITAEKSAQLIFRDDYCAK